jgi:dolichyl-diphosphooligosaccharide---protein glycosyltransferase
LKGKKPKAKKTPHATYAETEKAKDPSDEARYIGCFASETMFGDRVYNGGSTGANYNLALHHAKTSKKRYFAVARGGGDGHAFAFSTLDTSRGSMQGGGCERPCLDLDYKACGCADAACTGPIPKGEDNNRRWTVYEVLPSKK